MTECSPLARYDHADLFVCNRPPPPKPLVRRDTEQHRERVLGLPIRSIQQCRQIVWHNARLVQCEPLFRTVRNGGK